MLLLLLRWPSRQPDLTGLESINVGKRSSREVSYSNTMPSPSTKRPARDRVGEPSCVVSRPADRIERERESRENSESSWKRNKTHSIQIHDLSLCVCVCLFGLARSLAKTTSSSDVYVLRRRRRRRRRRDLDHLTGGTLTSGGGSLWRREIATGAKLGHLAGKTIHPIGHDLVGRSSSGIVSIEQPERSERDC